MMRIGFSSSSWALFTVIGCCVGGYSLGVADADEMTTYTVREGWHFSFPRLLQRERDLEQVEWQVVFHENCRYEIRDADGSLSTDQLDWNKLCGIFYGYTNTRGDAAMIGWRYNPDNREIELAPYYHVDRGRDMFPPLLTVVPGDTLQVRLQVDREQQKYRWTITEGERAVEHAFPFTHERRNSGFINFYFGGNRRAPRDVSCEMRLTVD